MEFASDIAALEDESVSPFDKWETIRRLEHVDKETISSTNCAAALMKLFKHEQSLVKHAALELVSKACPSRNNQALVRALMKVVEAPKDKMDSHSRVLALGALARCTPPDDFLCLESVASACKHEETEIRKAAVKCLGQVSSDSGERSHPRISRKLLPLLQDFDGGVREQAVRALAKVSSFKDEPCIIAMAMTASRDTSTAVRKAAEDALMQCYEHDLGSLGDLTGEVSRIKTELREINCQLEPGFAALIGLDPLPASPKKSR